MTKIKNFIMGPLFRAYSYLLFINFFFFVLYQLYNRLLRERLPLDLNDPVGTLQFAIYGYILATNIILLLLLLVVTIKDRYGDPKKVGFFTNLGKKISDFFVLRVLKPISDVYFELIYDTIPLKYERFWLALSIVFNKQSSLVRLSYFYGMLILPKAIVLVCFLIDVFIFQCFYYFYRVLWLLLFPLLLRFLYYTYRFIHIDVPERIMEEMDESPVAPGPITDEQAAMILADFQENMGPILQAQEEILNTMAASPWYIRVYHYIKGEIYSFRNDLRRQATAEALYAYNLRAYASLHALGDAIIVFDAIKKETYFALNCIIRTGYIIGWSAVLLHQGDLVEKYWMI